MTFYEAALRILESEGRPLHFLEITEKSIAQNLLSHVGKTPEMTMLSRLAAMARRTRDRKVIVTAKDTFALVDWALPEDAEALAQTGVVEAHPEEDLPPLRPVERHPEPRGDNVRVAGRGSERKRRRDEEEERGGGRKRRFPPLPEVVFEILSDSESGLRAEQLIERARTRELCPEDVTVEAVLTALLEDNQRRIDAGRRPQFAFNKQTSEVVTLERAGAPSEAPPLELQAAFAAALGIPLKDGRPVLGKAEATAVAEAAVDPTLLTTLKTTLKDVRRSVARSLRKRLGEVDVGTFEKSVVKMMHALHFRELKVAKRSKEGPLLTARKREGSVELRFAVRMLKGNPAIDRKTVQELRRDLSHYSAQVGLLVSAGDVRGDARSEAQASGSLVMLWCGDALGEKFLEAKTAVTVTQVELFDIDERFFEAAKLDAEEAQKRREERQRERQARDEDKPEKPARKAARVEVEAEGEDEEARVEEPKAEEAVAEARPARPAPESPKPAAASASEEEDEEGEEGDEEGEDEDLEAASAFVAGGGSRPEGAASAEGGSAAGERKRRRRRRRGRRGRGARAEAGAPGTTPAGGTPVVEGSAPAAADAPTGEAASSDGELVRPPEPAAVAAEPPSQAAEPSQAPEPARTEELPPPAPTSGPSEGSAT
ncbi:HTH domain-containing protein [Hyalangium rubrum]|uniref:HTH domain-containing protein n=1 Tax=Hyalangium rubrum TaxID=3103134 RepID=A0ABU5H434_9BACT|nr:restriction endonuclease [Hyalangium sp. s54d21]MDY7228071.1 HTH domain-containing protein [Hyalangium sp. s54d21]